MLHIMQPLVFTINTNMKCKWPSNHVSISSTGKYRPCCAWEEQDNQVDIATNSIDDYLNSEFYNNLMTDMKADRFAVGCTECILDEQAGIEGMVYNGNRRNFLDKEKNVLLKIHCLNNFYLNLYQSSYFEFRKMIFFF